jgi:hypothetical protein
VQSPFSGFSSYWHSGQQYSALPLLSQHAQQHTPSSMLWTPPGNSNSLSSFQQQQQQLVVQGRSLVSSCWAALRRLHCYVAAMGISFFVPCFIFPAMLSPEAGSVSARRTRVAGHAWEQLGWRGACASLYEPCALCFVWSPMLGLLLASDRPLCAQARCLKLLLLL